MKRIVLSFSLAAIFIAGFVLFCSSAQGVDKADAELSVITKDIPAAWWDGGWNKLDELQNFIAKYPDKPLLSAQAQYYVGCYYYSIKDYSSAIRGYEAVMTNYPAAEVFCVKAQYEIAQIYLNCLHEPDTAIREYEKILSNYSDMNLRPIAQLMIGKAYADLEDYAKAEEAYKKVVEDYPKAARQRFEAYMGLGDSLMSQASNTTDKAKISSAISYYKKAYQICPLEETNLLQYAISKIYEALKYLDNSVVRANKFIKYQKYGPEGQDGISGTADDLTDPLAGF